MKFDTIYRYFLNSVDSESLSSMADDVLERFLEDWLMVAVNEITFPKVPMTYVIWDTGSDADNPILPGTPSEPINPGLEFDSAVPVNNYKSFTDLTMREVLVLVAFMKKGYLEQVMDSDSGQQLYYDKDVRVFSPSQLIQQRRSRYENANKEARQALTKYYSVEVDGIAATRNLYE